MPDRIYTWLLPILLAAFLVSCDKQGKPIEEFGLDKLEKGVSTEAEVRMVMGQPDTVWEEDGRRILEYPKGPEGVRTWMFGIDRNGKLADYRQVLTDENFARIRPGMTRDEVRRLLGRPRTVVPFKLKNEEVWDWRYLSGTTTRFFNVHFDMGTGKVAGTSAQDDMHT
jgi:outer membrane protein assembly factor BamE (lipoprotein component of BamABCDE complex)